jgi:hypothetical protein
LRKPRQVQSPENGFKWARLLLPCTGFKLFESNTPLKILCQNIFFKKKGKEEKDRNFNTPILFAHH